MQGMATSSDYFLMEVRCSMMCVVAGVKWRPETCATRRRRYPTETSYARQIMKLSVHAIRCLERCLPHLSVWNSNFKLNIPPSKKLPIKTKVVCARITEHKFSGRDCAV
jgi:hypothetical protein